MSWGHQWLTFYLPGRPPVRPAIHLSVRMQNFESRIGAIYSLPYITDTLYYVNVKLFVDPAFRPQLTNSTQINSVSADELGPPVASFSLTRPAVRMQNFES